MSKYIFKATSSVEQYCDEIIDKMMELFNISHKEANGRLNDFWSHVEYMDDDDMVFHMLPDEWAHSIYYGHNSCWWKGTEGLTPLPYHEDDHDNTGAKKA